MLSERLPDQPLFYRLYVNRDEDLRRRADAAKFDVIMLTADVPVGSKRGRDLCVMGKFERPAGGCL